MDNSRQNRRQAISDGHTCPECGAQGPHPTNGETGYHKAYCCETCGSHWDAVDWLALVFEAHHEAEEALLTTL